MHERRHCGDHDQHDRSQTVHTDRPVCAQRTTFDPTQELDFLGHTIMGQKHNPAERTCDKQQSRGDPHCCALTCETPAKSTDQSPDKRREKNERFHLISLSSR